MLELVQAFRGKSCDQHKAVTLLVRVSVGVLVAVASALFAAIWNASAFHSTVGRHETQLTEHKTLIAEQGKDITAVNNAVIEMRTDVKWIIQALGGNPDTHERQREERGSRAGG